MRNHIKLAFLLSKRLYKKASFVAILVSLVIVTLLCSTALSAESSMVKVGLTGDKDNEIIKKLITSDGAVDYRYLDADEAEELLISGKIDAAVGFEEDFDAAVDEFLNDRGAPPVSVTVRECDIFINLALERIYAELFPTLADNLYYTYGENRFGSDSLPELEKRLAEQMDTEGFVEFSYYNSDDRVEDTNYLLSPLRGILAVILLFGMMASALYFLHDKESGKLEYLPIKRHYGRLMLYLLAGGVNIGLFVLPSLYLAGLFEGLLAETALLLLYIIASAGFVSLICALAERTILLASVIPILTVGILAVCPIFLNMHIPFVSELFPTYHYLTALHNPSAIGGMALYTLSVTAISFLVWKIKKRS